MCIPLRELTPYSSGRWRIKARVVAKDSVRHFTNARGEGSLFKIDIQDKDGFEMSATFFGKVCVERYYELFRVGQVFYFSRGSAKAANKRFDKGDVVVTFDENSSIESAPEDSAIPGITYHFRALEELATLEMHTNIDVKAVIAEVRDLSSIVVRATGKEKAKRDLMLWDNSGAGTCFVEATVWDNVAQADFQVGHVCYFRGARVNEWNGAKSLSVSGNIELNPVDAAAVALVQAYEAAGRPRSAGGFGSGAGMRATARRETIQECKDADMLLGLAPEKGQPLVAVPGAPRSVFRHNVTVTLSCVMADRQPFYYACPEQVETGRAQPNGQASEERRSCNKKSVMEGGVWRCAGGHVCQQPAARYMCQRVRVLDHTGSSDISFFDDVGLKVFGQDASGLAQIWDDPARESERDAFLSKASWKRIQLRLKSQRETWNDEERIKLNAEDASHPDYVKEGKSMLAEIRASLGG
jgi:replication factor A1